jgi:uncharacterized membrane protein
MKRSRKLKPPILPIRLARLHARLLISVLFGIAVTAGLMGTDWRIPTRLLAGWDFGVVLYLILTYWMILMCGVPEIRRRAAADDEGAVALLFLTGFAALAALGAIIAELGGAKNSNGTEAALHIFCGMATIVLSWIFVHTIFALHYAHEFYGERGDKALGGLNFPGRQPPDYWDFLYFSLVIAMTSQVSDVTIESRVIRRVVGIHGVLAFFFNLAILALTINMVSNLI